MAQRGSPALRIIVILVVVGALVPGLFMAFGAFDDPATESTTEVVSESSDPGAFGIIGILGFIALSFVASGFLARYLLRKTSRADVLEGGVAATATILSMAETGTTVNDSPMVEFGLRVTADGQGPYDTTMKQVMPRLMIGLVHPGIQVPVKVMPTDRNEVAIDFGALGAGGAAAGPGTVQTGPLAGTPILGTVDAEEFLVRAIPATGEIDVMAEAGTTATNPRTGQTLESFTFTMTVHRDGQAPYATNLLQGVPQEYIGTIGPGGKVPIGVNPDDPTDIAINWRELDRQRRTGQV
jgi:hypothetical protein